MDFSELQSAFAQDPVTCLAVLIGGAITAFLASQLLHYAIFAESLTPKILTVDPPPQILDSYKWDLSACTSLPEVRDGKIYPKCPADGRTLTTEPIIPHTTNEIDAAIQRATAAQLEWRNTTFAERRALLTTLLHFVTTHQTELATTAALDSGKTLIDASFGEILVTTEKLQWTIKNGEKALAPSYRGTNLLMTYKSNSVHYEPLGVVSACFSWNYPFHSWISCVISALFSGNAIVLKPSEQTCWSSLYFLRIMRAALKAHGHSEELVQNVICLPDTADHLTSHPGIKHITFIGSQVVAKRVLVSAAKSLTPVTVELGGKDPAIICDDPGTIKDIDTVVSILMRGTFQGAGQNCIGIERIIALPGVYNLIRDKMLERIKTMRLGSITHPDTKSEGIDMGSLISSASIPRLESLISSAVTEGGAILHHGGKAHSHPKHPHGTYFTPTLISFPSSPSKDHSTLPTHAITQTELFAPIALLLPASSLSHAIAISNSAPYSLGASLFTRNPSYIPLVRRTLRTGMLSVNDFGAYYLCSLPFGGVGGSGYGRFGGAEGLRGLCNPVSVCEETWWARLLGVRTQIPGVLQYPVGNEGGWKAVCGIVGVGYAVGVRGRVQGVVDLMGGLMGGEKKKEV